MPYNCTKKGAIYHKIYDLGQDVRAVTNVRFVTKFASCHKIVTKRRIDKFVDLTKESFGKDFSIL